MQNQTIAQIGKLMTKNQKAKFAALQGKPFDLAKLISDPEHPRPSPRQRHKAAATQGLRASRRTTGEAPRPGQRPAERSTTKKKGTDRQDAASEDPAAARSN